MTLLQWKPQYSVGIESMDFEHRQLIGLINELYTELHSRRYRLSVEQFLGDIHAGIAAHFALEERIMRDAGYQEYEAHKHDHEDLLEQIRSMMDTFAADTEAGFVTLSNGLSDWFAAHFSTFDARMHGKLDAGSG